MQTTPYRKTPSDSRTISPDHSNAQLLEIQAELEGLKERRRALEQQRKQLLTARPKSATHSSTRSSSVRSTNRSESAMDQKQTIPSEKERRERISHSVYLEMKEEMKKAWQHDSTLIGGYFGMNDNPHNCTFSRERRFVPLCGTKGAYYLGTDVLEMQRKAKVGDNQHLTAGSRGRSGCNVVSNWNDSRGGGAPGPGAYTPRYQKLASPSILTKLR
jgi:hypothetical protein